jgi:hypothetical protein
MTTLTTTEAAIAAVFTDVAASQSITLKPLTPELELLQSGMDSLCFAIAIARLEDETGIDPFSEMDQAFFPVTFGEFVKLYER